MMRLSQKHRLFVEAYEGDPIKAMRLAGFNGTDSYLNQKSKELLAMPLIQKAIEDRKSYVASLKDTIATREERQALWTQIMKNEDPYRKEEFDPNGVPIPEGNIPLPIRLKASELLGKSEADFIDKVDMNHNVSLSDIILKSYDKDSGKSIEEIEAEYYELEEQRSLEAPKNVDDLI
jgi:phage terminase small subunit